MRPTGAQLGAVAGVAALAIVVGALSVTALQQARPSTPQGNAAPAPTFDFSDDGAAPSPTPSDAPEAPSFAADAERFLAVQGDRLWRSTAGTCGGPAPVVELSTDRGQSWTDVTPPDATQIFTTSALGDIAGETVAATDDDCAPTVLRTYTNGLEWSSYPEALGDATFLSPADSTTIVTPGSDPTAPCDDARSVRASRGVVGLICGSTAYALVDGDWIELATKASAVDAVAGTIVVAHHADGCEGVAITRHDGAAVDELACIDDADPADPAAVSLLGDDLALWSGDAVYFG